MDSSTIADNGRDARALAQALAWIFARAWASISVNDAGRVTVTITVDQGPGQKRKYRTTTCSVRTLSINERIIECAAKLAEWHPQAEGRDDG